MHNKEVLLSKFEYIRDHIQTIINYTSDISNADDYVNTVQGGILLDATIMRLQALGENLKQIEQKAPEIFEKHPEVEWVKIIRFRDVISHHYEKLESEIIYEICTDFIPKLEKVIDKIIMEINTSTN